MALRVRVCVCVKKKKKKKKGNRQKENESVKDARRKGRKGGNGCDDCVYGE